MPVIRGPNNNPLPCVTVISTQASIRALEHYSTHQSQRSVSSRKTEIILLLFLFPGIFYSFFILCPNIYTIQHSGSSINSHFCVHEIANDIPVSFKASKIFPSLLFWSHILLLIHIVYLQTNEFVAVSQICLLHFHLHALAHITPSPEVIPLSS